MAKPVLPSTPVEDMFKRIMRIEGEIEAEHGIRNTRDTIYLELTANRNVDEAELKKKVAGMYGK